MVTNWKYFNFYRTHSTTWRSNWRSSRTHATEVPRLNLVVPRQRMEGVVFSKGSRMQRFPSIVCLENSRDTRHNRERMREHHKGDQGASIKGIPVELVQEKRALKPTGSKWDLINPTGSFLLFVDVRAEKRPLKEETSWCWDRWNTTRCRSR